MKRRNFLKGLLTTAAAAVSVKSTASPISKPVEMLTKKIVRIPDSNYSEFGVNCDSGKVTDGEFIVYYDLTAGYQGWNHPVGTKVKPANTIANALNILKDLQA